MREAGVPYEASVAKAKGQTAEEAPKGSAVDLVKREAESAGAKLAPRIANFTVDYNSPLPDFLEKGEANKVYSEKFGITEKWPILGKPVKFNAFGKERTIPSIWGGKGRVDSPEMEAVATWFVENHGVVPALTKRLGIQLGGKFNKVFQAKRTGKLDEIGDVNVS